MIFVTVGTTKYPFKRLIDYSINQSKFFPDEQFFIQSGTYTYEKKLPSNIIIKPLFSFNETQNLLKKCRVVICHGGSGTIFQCWEYGKKPLVLPRLKKLGEHANDHQLYMSQYLAKKNKVQLINTDLDLNSFLKENKHKMHKNIPSSKSNLVKYLFSLC